MCACAQRVTKMGRFPIFETNITKKQYCISHDTIPSATGSHAEAAAKSGWDLFRSTETDHEQILYSSTGVCHDKHSNLILTVQ